MLCCAGALAGTRRQLPQCWRCGAGCVAGSSSPVTQLCTGGVMWAQGWTGGWRRGRWLVKHEPPLLCLMLGGRWRLAAQRAEQPCLTLLHPSLRPRNTILTQRDTHAAALMHPGRSADSCASPVQAAWYLHCCRHWLCFLAYSANILFCSWKPVFASFARQPVSQCQPQALRQCPTGSDTGLRLGLHRIPLRPLCHCAAFQRQSVCYRACFVLSHLAGRHA